ncbi:MAG: helix-turn-helix transcriptional regulator [Clostridiales bacterium]|nr:helix-turn-helix transcriptional regulator [Clostridiales bacterium]
MDLYKIVGFAIRNLRRQKALSQNSVCNRSGVNHSYYCNIERGTANPTVKILYDIISALGVSPAEFADAISVVIHDACVTSDIGSVGE